MTSRLLHVSIHDVAPFHLARVQKAEALLKELGIDKVTCLLVPDFHHLGRSDRSSKMQAYCRETNGIAREWSLHGYYHLETHVPGDAEAPQRPWRKRIVAATMTAGEGEFHSLAQIDAASRIRQGREVFESCLGYNPEVFVAPAWLAASHLQQTLRNHDFRFTEDHRNIYDLVQGKSYRARAITWATRTPIRKATSIAGVPLLAASLRFARLVRVAVHPYDFDHPATVASIRTTLQSLARDRVCTHIREIPEHLR